MNQRAYHKNFIELCSKQNELYARYCTNPPIFWILFMQFPLCCGKVWTRSGKCTKKKRISHAGNGGKPVAEWEREHLTH